MEQAPQLFPHDHADRAELLEILATMPEELFGYLHVWCRGGVKVALPDPADAAGFSRESQDALIKLRQAVARRRGAGDV